MESASLEDYVTYPEICILYHASIRGPIQTRDKRMVGRWAQSGGTEMQWLHDNPQTESIKNCETNWHQGFARLKQPESTSGDSLHLGTWVTWYENGPGSEFHSCSLVSLLNHDSPTFCYRWILEQTVRIATHPCRTGLWRWSLSGFVAASFTCLTRSPNLLPPLRLLLESLLEPSSLEE